jgi:glucose/arabinose dehydrogenase
MIRTTLAAFAAGAVLAAAPAAFAQEAINAEVYVSGLTLPLEFVQNPVDDSIQYVVQQNGIIRVIDDGALVPGSFLNVQSRISSGGERGLLGMAFDPDFATNGRFYINYTNTVGNTHVARYEVNNNLSADFNSEEVILVVGQDFANHNGGNLRIGPDDYLYIALGDGGSGGDPFNRAQNRTSLLGSILRIDISTPTGYDIPADNPYVGVASFRDEIWAYGVRNPWKFTFDTGPCGTDAIAIADVGQNAREEININPNEPGLNYGWDCREGTLNFSGCNPPAGESFTQPVFEYTHSSGFGRSITGGYIYRGAEMVHNRGRYFYADFLTGRVASLDVEFDSAGNATTSDFIEHTSQLGGVGNVSAFGRDADGELYILSFNGRVYRITGTFRPGDTNKDSVIDATDLAALIGAWGSSDCGVADLDNDENVGASDLAILIGGWGS